MKERNVYSLLNEDSKTWWYHRQLRRMRQDKKARKLERQSIRNKVRVFRETLKHEGFLLILSENRFVLYISPLHTLSGYHEELIKLCCYRLKIPVYELPESGSTALILNEPKFSECRRYYGQFEI